MLVVRGTKKLRDRAKGPLGGSADVSTTELGDWFATALFWKPQVALLVNARTMLPMFVPLTPASSPEASSREGRRWLRRRTDHVQPPSGAR